MSLDLPFLVVDADGSVQDNFDKLRLDAQSANDVNAAIAARRYATTITGNGALTTFTVTHNLATTDVLAQAQDSTGVITSTPIITANTLNTVTVAFGAPVPNGTTYRVIIAS